jgi:hypothetical protein
VLALLKGLVTPRERPVPGAYEVSPQCHHEGFIASGASGGTENPGTGYTFKLSSPKCGGRGIIHTNGAPE